MTESETIIQQLEHQLTRERQKRETLEYELVEARWAAEAAQRAKSAFIANMSHELHTPLNAIIGFAEVLQDDIRQGDFSGAKSDLAKIKQAGVHLLSIVNELLDLAKIESDSMTLQLEPYLLQLEITRAVEETRPILEQQGNKLEISLDPTLYELYGDGAKVRQILGHLLDNAAKFTVEGTIKIEATAVDIAGNTAVQISVSDTGIGLAPAHRNIIFDTFTQVDASSTRHYEGAGLGLYISQRLAMLLGGKIEVESELGVGSTFSFYFPPHIEPD